MQPRCLAGFGSPEIQFQADIDDNGIATPRERRNLSVKTGSETVPR